MQFNFITFVCYTNIYIIYIYSSDIHVSYIDKPSGKVGTFIEPTTNQDSCTWPQKARRLAQILYTMPI
jgi:hypothetical protein